MSVPAIGASADATWTIRTDVFDGPLDLLLYLVKRDGIDIRTLRMSAIADSYLGYLDRMRDLNLSIAADYLVLAATLVHLKSLELLPRLPTPIDEDEEDPREALARQLRDLERYRAAAVDLGARPQVGVDVFVREPLDLPEPVLLVVPGVDAFGLLEQFYALLRRSEEPDPVVQVEAVGPDLRGCGGHVVTALQRGGGRFELGALLRGLTSRIERVVTFIVILEMVRLQWLDVEQVSLHRPIEVSRRVPLEQFDLAEIAGIVHMENTEESHTMEEAGA